MVPSSVETGTRNIGDVVKPYPLQEVLFRGDQSVISSAELEIWGPGQNFQFGPLQWHRQDLGLVRASAGGRWRSDSLSSSRHHIRYATARAYRPRCFLMHDVFHIIII